MTFYETTTVFSPNSGVRKIDVIFTLVALLCVVPVLLVILSVPLCKQYKNSKRRRSSQISRQSNSRQLQMHPLDRSNENLSSTDHVILSNTITDARTEGHPFSDHHQNVFSDVTTHQENPYHIFQDAAEVNKGPSHTSNLQQVSRCAVPMENKVTSSEHASVSIPCVYENHGVRETSLDQTASCYEDCEYQDVDLCRKDWLTKRSPRSVDVPHLFDERCYNSLNFGKRSAQNIAMSRDSEYDHYNPSFLDKGPQCSLTDVSASGPSSQSEVHSNRNDDVGPIPTVKCEDVFYYQLHPDEASRIETLNKPLFTDAFDSGEYCLLNPDKASTHDGHPINRDDIRNHCYNPQNPFTHDSTTRPCEELYATVNKAFGEHSAAKPTTCEELIYSTVNKTVGSYSATKPVTCEELYAKVDKTKEGRIDKKATSQEELYMNITNT
ncbi:uncharacterized protein [Diadema antillarum]|uniref:uncharacterized protein n=1 Tax=Diadema antillarum TaxID=105358 RepID=UPI003A888423